MFFRHRIRALPLLMVTLLTPAQAMKPTKAASWTIVAYIQADNDLAPFATYNINDMQLAPLGNNVNMLVQWDQPNNRKTWRYRIVKGGRIEDASLSAEMGINPVNELVDMMKWAKTKYDAQKFAVILWNHGSGALDRHSKKIAALYPTTSTQPLPQPVAPWLEIPGLSLTTSSRGILYDYSQNTYATNQDLTTAFSRIRKEVLKKNVDIVGMDACLMAMIEVGLQIDDYANLLVGSQQVEPGEGWSYSGFLNALCANPNASPIQLATYIVGAYGAFYKKNGETDFTQSAINLSKLETLKQNINFLIAAVTACRKADLQNTKSMVIAARKATLSFYISDYIDLNNFYAVLKTRAQALRTKQEKLTRPNTALLTALDALIKIINNGLDIIDDTVLANVAGSAKAAAHGISIYYPLGSVHSSYPRTQFAKTTQWVGFIKEYR